jgi:copper chaperone CopZ
MKKLLFTTLFLLGVFSTMTFSAPDVVSNDISSKSLGQTKSNFHNKCKLSVEVSNFYDKDIVERDLKQNDGVNEVYLDLDEKVIYVSYDNSITSADKLCKSVNDLGYSSKVIEEASK